MAIFYFLGGKLMFKHKSRDPLAWPAKPNFAFDLNADEVLPINSAVVIFDDTKITQSQKAFLLSMFDPAKTKTDFVEMNNAKQIFNKYNLTPDSYLMYRVQLNQKLPIIRPLFLPDQKFNELDFLLIEDVASQITAMPTLA